MIIIDAYRKQISKCRNLNPAYDYFPYRGVSYHYFSRVPFCYRLDCEKDIVRPVIRAASRKMT